MKVKKYIVLLFIFLIAIISLSACMPWQEKKAPPRLSLVTVDSPALKLLNIPFYVALENGYFKEQGLDFSFDYAKNNEEALEKLIKGDFNAAFLNTDQIILQKKMNKEKLVVFMNSFQGLGSHLVSRESMPSFQWQELKDTTIVGQNLDSVPQMALECVLRQNELVPQEGVTIFRNLPYRLMPGAFKGGVGNYLYIFDPIATQLEASDQGHIVATLGPKTVDFSLQSYFSSEKFLKSHPVASQKFVNGVYKAQLWMQKYPSTKTVKLIEEHFSDLDEATLLKIVDRYKAADFWKPEPSPRQESLDSLQDTLIEGGVIHEKLPSNDLVFTTYAEKAVKSVTLPVEKKKTFWDKVKDKFK